MIWNYALLITVAALALPLQDRTGWQLLEYDGIPANQVTFGEQGMLIAVDRSASPIILPLSEPQSVSRITVTGELDGLLKLEAGRQGLEGADDFSVKIGLVVAGDKRLNFMQRMVSAEWVKTLFDLAPEDAGIDHILFLNAVQSESQLGHQRQHPLSDLIYERYVWLLDRSGAFDLEYELETPKDIVAVWLSIDGDDSGSSFSTMIKRLTLEGPG